MKISKYPGIILISLLSNLKDDPEEIKLIKTLRDGGFMKEAEQVHKAYVDSLEIAIKVLGENKISF